MLKSLVLFGVFVREIIFQKAFLYQNLILPICIKKFPAICRERPLNSIYSLTLARAYSHQLPPSHQLA